MAVQQELANLKSISVECNLVVTALRACLEEAGVLRQDTLSARLHRIRFATYLAQHPLVSTSHLEPVLSTYDIALAAGAYAGPVAVATLASASRRLSNAAGDTLPLLRERYLMHRRILVCGGTPDLYEYSNTSEMFLTASGAWEAAPPMSEQRAGAAAGTVAGKLYVCGGFYGDRTFSSVEEFDFAAGTWTVRPSMLTARGCAAGTVLGGQLYICGGRDDQYRVLDTVERFWPETQHEPADPGGLDTGGVWEAVPPMDVGRAYLAGGALNGRLYVCCGAVVLVRGMPYDAETPIDVVEQFHPETSSWILGPRMLHARFAASLAATSGRIYVCGGCGGEAVLSLVEVLDPAEGAWQVVHEMLARRSGAAAVAAAGHIYVFGGTDGNLRLNSVERFDPATGFWTALARMCERRWVVVAGTASC